MQSPTRKAASTKAEAARGRSIEGCCRLLKAAAKAAVILHSGLAAAICYAPVVHYRHPASTMVYVRVVPPQCSAFTLNE